jgi:hypothetical protein
VTLHMVPRALLKDPAGILLTDERMLSAGQRASSWFGSKRFELEASQRMEPHERQRLYGCHLGSDQRQRLKLRSIGIRTS